MSKPKKNPVWVEMLPLICFFIAFKWQGIMAATAVLVVITLITLTAIYIKDKRIAYMPLFTAVIVTIFGVLTIALQDERFIKMKPTIINIAFSMILWGGLIFKKNLMKSVFGHGFEMEDSAWRVFTLRWSYFFIFLAGLNEYIWRNFSTDFWVQFKVFGILGLSFAFVLSQTPFLHKHANISEDK